MAYGSPASVSDGTYLQAYRREPRLANLQPLLERYAGFVYSSAYRRMGSEQRAREVAEAVFLVLARRARKLRKRTVLPGWLFHVTALTCRKLKRKSRQTGRWGWFARKPKSDLPPDAPLWDRVVPELDAAFDRLSARERNALLLRVVLNESWESVAQALHISERRAGKRVERGLKKLARRLRRRGISANINDLSQACSAQACATPLPEGLLPAILASIEATAGKRPTLKLARSTLRSLAWARWRRRFLIGYPAFNLLLVIIGVIAWQIDARSGHSRFTSELIFWWVRYNEMATPGLLEPARSWPTSTTTPRLNASLAHNAQDIYQITNIWLAHLNFTREQWKALAPKRIGPMPNFKQTNGMWLQNNPKAPRSGVVGVLGYEFDWTNGDFEFGGLAFTNVGVRAKGNVASLFSTRRSFKVDLNRFAKGQKLAGLDELTFKNLIWEYSFLGEALGYEIFRDARVPAPRTAYAWLSVTVAEKFDRKPLGLYLMIEPVHKAFVAERFGSKKTPVFKPVTYNLFEYLGDNWSAYAAIYDLKTQATSQQLRRVIDFARLVSSAPDAEFAGKIGNFLDLDELARFLAVQVLLSNYDSPLALGHNFYLYLDPRSNKFGFVPWDVETSFGDFWIGSKGELERASIWHPWIGENRFIARVMGVEEFRRLYRAHLEDFLTRLFVPERLNRRIDEMAALLHDPVAAESSFRLDKFEQSVGMKPLTPSPGENENGLNHPAHQLKRFIEARAKSVRLQLDGKSPGMILKYPQRR